MVLPEDYVYNEKIEGKIIGFKFRGLSGPVALYGGLGVMMFALILMGAVMVKIGRRNRF